MSQTESATGAPVLTIEQAIDAVRQVVARRRGPERQIEATTRFKDLEFDSLDVAELVVALEDRCGLELDPKSAKDVEVVEELLRLRPLGGPPADAPDPA